MKRTVIILLALTILLSGCVSSQPEPTGPALNDPSTPSQTYAYDPDAKPTKSTSATQPTATAAPTKAPVPEQFKYFEEMLTNYHTIGTYNFYNLATFCTFSSPKELNMRELLYNGIGRAGSHKLTEAELAHFTAIEPTLAYVDANRMRPEEIDAILTLYFDITLDEINKEGKEYLIYWEETNCYYTFGTDMQWNYHITVTDCKENEDGTVQVFYKTRYQEYDNYVMTLKRVNSIYKILSNLPA